MDQLRINVTIKYVILVIGVLCTIVIAALVWFNSQPLDVLFSSIAAGAAITALIYTALNTQSTGQIRVEQLRLKKLENAMTFIEYSSSPAMIQAVTTARAVRQEIKGKTTAETQRLLEISPEKTQALVMIFNYFERLGIIVRLGAADEQALRDYYQTAVKRYWHSFHPWIEEQRNEFQDSSLFAETQSLARRWN